ncbi:hypothetical protein IAT38_007477 [Cryptococcus sp. DSM 104549]
MIFDNGTIIDPPGPADPQPPPTDPERCKLLGTTGLVVQALMGVLVILSLVLKKRLEKRKRSWRIWVMDVGKQLVGQALVHALNLLISDLVASVANNNPCSLYFLNVLIDTTIGVAIIYFSLKFFTWYFSKHLGYEGFISGKYGTPPQPVFWWKQLVTYLLSIITMKLLVVLPLTLPRISDLLLHLGHHMLQYLSPRIQVIFVMAVFPLIMNVIQFCLVDQVIKEKNVEDTEDGEGAEGGGAAGARGAGRTRSRAGRGGEGYERVPEWDDDAERGEAPTRRKVVKEGDSTEPGVLPPSSPLLTPSGYDVNYGSTTPSPSGSPTKASGGDGSLWARILGSRSPVEEGSNGGSSREPWWEYDGGDGDGAGRGSGRLGGKHGQAEEGRLGVSRDERSAAPSPDSMRPTSLPSPVPPPEPLFSPAPGTSPSPSSAGGSGSAAAGYDASQKHTTPSPSTGVDSPDARLRTPSTSTPTDTEWGTASFSHPHSSHPQARRLTADAEREARLTLSPPASPTVYQPGRGSGSGEDGEGGDAMGLREWGVREEREER